MKVTILSSNLVRPAGPTPHGPMPLTESDQTGVITHVPTIYFYNPPDRYPVLSALKSSLARALVHFYPLAGRLRWLGGARLELVCSGEGALLLEARADSGLEALGPDLVPSPDFRDLVPKIDYRGPIEGIPLLAVQVTGFLCGAVAVGCMISHAAADGRSALHFMSDWARLARGEPLAEPPFLDRRVLRAGEPPVAAAVPRFRHEQFDPPPLLLGQTSSDVEREKETTVAMLKMSRIQVDGRVKVESLRHRANRTRTTARPHTRYEAIAAHIWKSACRARKHAGNQPTAVGICVDVRRRVAPPLPEKFFGNAIVDVVARAKSGEISENPLGHAAGRIREAIDGVTHEYVHSAIDFLKNLEDFSRLQDIHGLRTGRGPFYGNPNVSVISWAGLPLNGLDFGWGKEFFMSPGTHDCDGDSVVLPGRDGDGSVVVALCLQAECMEEFKKWFYGDIEM